MKRRVRVLGLLPHVDHDPLGRRRHQLDPLLGRLLHRQLKGKCTLSMLSFAAARSSELPMSGCNQINVQGETP